MPRAPIKADLTLTLSGVGAKHGALSPEDLEDLGAILRAAKSSDPALKELAMVGSIRKGSAVISLSCGAVPGLEDIHPARDALTGFFRAWGYDETIGWRWPKSARQAVNRMTKRGLEFGMAVTGSGGLRQVLRRADFERLHRHIAQDPTWHWMTGKLLEVDLKDKTFELHTAEGTLTCPFPPTEIEPSWRELLNREVESHVLVRPKPTKGPWSADQSRSIFPRGLSEPGLFEAVGEILPPQKTLVGGFQPGFLQMSVPDDVLEAWDSALSSFGEK